MFVEVWKTHKHTHNKVRQLRVSYILMKVDVSLWLPKCVR